ncbi:type VI secretion system baseplate subunit TssG [Hymenobacter sp. RP-2-7]|uniref:Type VI secretion system baseplate subunit TssG n=1 Tax=Hymenobacter polaris TaxID=2682546 RepID=A0A7Y0AD19_9BACT|nr:type VI secretion system baseplate subunit TssG [Hymenobacter polaris]NML65123.1 type VI secretion system baseplate subunit TssG [Hymenobacter polaris]
MRSPSARELLERQCRQTFDVRLEVLLAELLAYGYAFEDFVVRPVSLFARRYRRDLGAVAEEPFERHHREVVRTVLEVHREGLYDALPQQVFHQPSGNPGGHPPDVRAMVADSLAQRRKEKATRKFFLPFEQEFFRYRVRLEQEERRYFNSLATNWYNEALARFWGLAEAGLPPVVLTNLLYLLPLACNIVGDLPRTQRCFESVLGHAVRLRSVAPQRHPLPAVPTNAQPTSGTLGSLALGRDLVLGGDYQETLPALEVTVQGLTVAELEAYLTNAWPATALALLCEYFVAFETDVVVRYDMAAAEPEFRLGEGEAAPVLGFTTAGI